MHIEAAQRLKMYQLMGALQVGWFEKWKEPA